jgi:threonyl-tRNA synthetase
MGCYERTLALLLEKYAGALPLWLSPNQVTVIPVSTAFNDYAEEVKNELSAIGVRVEAELGTDTMKYKIREAQLEKTPYIVIVGENEMNTKSVSVRARVEGQGGVMSLDDFKAKLLREIAEKKR